MLEASNLGQILGRLMHPEVEPVAPTEPALPRPVLARGARRLELVALLSDGVERSSSQIAEALKITLSNATMLLTLCTRHGLVKRTGERHSYRYTLPGALAGGPSP